MPSLNLSGNPNPLREPVGGAVENRGQVRPPSAADEQLSEAIRQGLARQQDFIDKAKVSGQGEFNDDDPSSPTYRWRDTGHIAGSRKEEAIGMIRLAAREGRRVKAEEIDWDAVEQNPRTAEDLITKANLFGTVDWQALQDKGMQPGAGYLIAKVYVAIGKAPDEANPTARRDFATALGTLRDRLEDKLEVEGVVSVLDGIREELTGSQMTEEQASIYRGLRATSDAAASAWRELRNRSEALYQPYQSLLLEFRVTEREIEKREARGWKVDPEQRAKAVEMKKKADAAYEIWLASKEIIRYIKFTDKGGRTHDEHPLETAAHEARQAVGEFVDGVRRENLLGSPLTRGWLRFGESFLRAVNYSRYRGSEAFATHVATAQRGKITDWSWLDARKGPKVITRGEAGFKLLIADAFTREGKGLRPVAIGSSKDLKDMFGLRDVQSGKWVLDEPESARWHMQACAEAFADLADGFHIRDESISLGGRLAMAFGARGHGSHTRAAHFEPVERVINLTKMGGGGSVAHEWFHALDNAVREIVTGETGAKHHHGTEDFDIPGPVGEAFKTLHAAMTQGSERVYVDLPYTESEERQMVASVQNQTSRSPSREAIRTAKDVGEAYDRLTAYHRQGLYGRAETRKAVGLLNSWLKVAAVYHGRNPERIAKLPVCRPMSKYMKEAVRLDRGQVGKYWSSPHEMAARAFGQWIEKGMASQGLRSDYLSCLQDNAYYALLGKKPFPEGEERTRIEAALKGLFAVLVVEGVLKAKEAAS